MDATLPFVPDIAIDGHLLLSLVLPPLLYSAALDVSFVGFKRSLPQIRRLEIWLVAWLILPSLTLYRVFAAIIAGRGVCDRRASGWVRYIGLQFRGC